ncbi:protein archease isoform X2 [Brevipalpus obovatus]|uniref:protein archease isoform X2 n=1 Tax=Brevipalpus obovatus TaxID=246614 RepID=UPI003D9F640A
MDAQIVDPEGDDLDLPPVKYEYLDHTADVQIHAWGETLKEAFEQAAIALGGYMTNLDTVKVEKVALLEAEGEDLVSLLYKWLDEVLFLFCAEPFLVIRNVIITEFDETNFKIKARCGGEAFDLNKHPQGTEIKAITYSNMQVHDKEVFVIIDI